MYQHNSFYLLLILDSLKVHVPAQQFLPSADIRQSQQFLPSVCTSTTVSTFMILDSLKVQHNSFYLLLILDSLKVHAPAQQFLPSADIRQSQSTCTSTTVSTF